MNKRLKILMMMVLLIIIPLMIYIYVSKKEGKYKIEEGDIKLEKNIINKGSLYEALEKRKSSREFSSKKLSEEMISNLLWSANGINREDGKRTAPSAMNKQEIELYVVLSSGVYLYVEEENLLKRISPENMTYKTGYNAPMSILYVIDKDKQDIKLGYVDSGFIGQNIYLFSALNDLNTVFKGSFDKEYFTKALELPENKEIIFMQDIGYKKEE